MEQPPRKYFGYERPVEVDNNINIPLLSTLTKMQKQYVVYAIGHISDLVPPFDRCYIGVTNKPDARWKYHQKSRYHVGCCIRKYNFTYEDNMIIISFGTKEECFQVERQLRPKANMGLNEAVGGQGGFTVYSTERNQKIAEALTGRQVTWAHKVSATKKARKAGVGASNVQAKRWVLTSPEGVVYEVHGTLDSFCDDHCLLRSSLMRYIDQTVPPLSKGYGGFRAKNEQSKRRRINTSGWQLSKCEE